jgi:hypothetical protein
VALSPVASAFAMTALRYTALLLVLLLSGCSLFSGGGDDGAPKKKSSLWSLGLKGPQDATEYLEYQRVHSEKDKSMIALVVRNTHTSKTVEGDVRTTIETGPGASKVDNMHFSLGPSDSAKLLVYPASTRLTYEVSAFFKE